MKAFLKKSLCRVEGGNIYTYVHSGTSGKEPTCQCRRHKRPGFDPWVRKIPLEKWMTVFSSILAWRTPWTEELVGLQCTGPQRVGHDGSNWVCMHTHTHTHSHTHTHTHSHTHIWASQVVLVVKNLPANARNVRDVGSTPGSGKSPGGGCGNPLQYSCLENAMDRWAWWATVHGIARVRHSLKTKPPPYIYLYISLYQNRMIENT